jgi:hypothetical protein
VPDHIAGTPRCSVWFRVRLIGDVAPRYGFAFQKQTAGPRRHRVSSLPRPGTLIGDGDEVVRACSCSGPNLVCGMGRVET